MATWVIGDVHGCLVELTSLVDAIAPTPEDHLVFVGDLVDRGPDSVGVVRFVRNLPCQVTVVRGNHEGKHARFRKGNPVKDPTGELANITRGLDAKDVRFLEQTVLAWTGVVEGKTYSVVHAGVTPWFKTLPTGALTEQEAKPYRWLTMVRYLTPEGNPVGLGSEGPDDKFWTQSYDGRFGTIVYGHQPCKDDQPVWTANTIGIDLGCCFGGSLAAVRLGDQKVIAVKAREQYSRHYGED